MYSYIQSRFYRSPEVLLGMPYSTAIDVWSLACILVELHTGEPLFPGQSEHDQLARMVKVLGLPPTAMLDASPKRAKFFTIDEGADGTRYELKPPPTTRSRGDTRPEGTLISDIVGARTGGPQGRRTGEPGHSEKDYDVFVDFVMSMLVYSPALRVTPLQALNHPFFA